MIANQQQIQEPNNGGSSPGQSVNLTESQFIQLGQLGVMFYQQGVLFKARKIFEVMIQINPSSGLAHSALGAVLARQRLDAKALEHLDRAIELDPHEISSYVNRGEIRLRQNQTEPALADLKRAIELDPQANDAGANRARAIVMGLYNSLKRASSN
jgi:tetratricopeptide (TPR) repeat protein